ncbi:MAG: IS4 family transposase [Gammaproteobacteria bacterium]|nr:IS4 family transposase [Gammaproteobacteria bacterium]
MSITDLLHAHLEKYCPEIHVSRLQAVMDVATGLQHSQQFSIAAIGRHLQSEAQLKHRIKKVDRLLANKHLYLEITDIYTGLSQYVFKYVAQDKISPIVIDLCFLKDDQDIQMLSAEIATQGRTIPLYRDVFEKGKLKGREKEFISKLSQCIPKEREVLIIMDAGFGDNWFEAIEAEQWYWLVRARSGKYLKLSENEEWKEASELFNQIGTRAKCYEGAYITKTEPRACRVITKKGCTKSKRKRPKILPRNYNSANGNYQRSPKEPWILATNLPKKYNTTQIMNAYKKRMQIEESFRDIKSTRYGLGGRYIETRCVYRWSVMMLLAAIVQITLWIIGVIGHSQGFQKVFQSNTVKDKKVFSYFYLGQLIVEFNKINELNFKYENLPTIIETELARVW